MGESKGSEEGAQTGNIFEGNLKGERVQKKKEGKESLRKVIAYSCTAF